jgi:hypothetical protein
MQFIRSQVPHESGPVPQARPVLGSRYAAVELAGD